MKKKNLEIKRNSEKRIKEMEDEKDKKIKQIEEKYEKLYKELESIKNQEQFIAFFNKYKNI
jgi:flagellar capping protein FliD